MSENMKKIYQAYADSIAPAPDMQARLKRQLYVQMQEEHPGNRRNCGKDSLSTKMLRPRNLRLHDKFFPCPAIY